MYLNRLGRLAGMVVACLVTPLALAAPLESRQVHIPVTLDAEGSRILTSACIKATERSYSSAQWWANADSRSLDSAERALRDVIEAMRKKDRGALQRLSDPQAIANQQLFDRQADAYFSQIESTQIESIPVAYDLGGALSFYAKFARKKKMPYAPLSFARRVDGATGFLPVRSDQIALRMLDLWFVSQANQSGAARTYCSQEAVRRFTHQVSIESGASLLMNGGSLVKPPPVLASVAQSVTTAIAAIRRAAQEKNPQSLSQLMTASGQSRLLQWSGSAKTEERTLYFESLDTMEPLFVFDASPLLVAYVKTRQGMQVLYFIRSNDGAARWTNSAHLSPADKIFKEGPLFEAAKTDPPFAALDISKAR